jgi:putative membrane protein
MKRMGFLSIALATVVAVGCDGNNRKEIAATHATGEPAAVGTSGEAGRNSVTSADKDFVHDAATAGMAEVELGKMATERGANADVKKFGQMMVDDHTAAGDKLKRLAAAHNIPVPTALDDKHRDLRDKLAKLQGADFDREYMDAMVDGHEGVADKLESRIDKENLAKWKTESNDRVAGTKAKVSGQAVAILPETSDNSITISINQWAAETYPTVQAHLVAAKALASALEKRTHTTR